MVVVVILELFVFTLGAHNCSSVCGGWVVVCRCELTMLLAPDLYT